MKRWTIALPLWMMACALSAQTDERNDSTLYQDLPELTVKGERPMAKKKGNTLAFDAQVLRDRFQPATAFDLLQHVPEIRVVGDAVSLVHAQAVLLVIDGRVNMVDAAQVVDRLKALPAAQVVSIDVSPVAPAKYNFTGALINVRTLSNTDQLTVMTESLLSQTRRTSTDERASVMYDRGRLSLFGAANYHYGDSHSTAYYSMADGYRCDTEIQNSYNSFSIKTEAAYLLGENTKVTADYYGYFFDETRKDFREAAFQGQPTLIRSRRLTDEALHSAGLELKLPGRWELSGRYKHFGSPYTQFYVTGKPGDSLDFSALPTQTSTQDIDNWRANLNKDFSFAQGAAQLSVGLTHDFTRTGTCTDYANVQTLGRQSEWNTAFYTQADFTLWTKLNVTVGLRGEKTRQLYQDRTTGKETTVWDDFWFFPTLQLSLPVNGKGHTLRLSLQSDKEFPDYWWISPQTTVIDDRSLSVGNPNMRPSRSYQLTLSYLTGKHWSFYLGSYYTKDGLARLPHYDAELGKTIYKGENFDFSLRNMLTVQWSKVFGRYTTTATARGMHSLHRIKNYYGTDYQSRDWEATVAWNNDYQLPLGKGGKLLLHTDFTYMSPMKFGFTEWSDSWSLNSFARWMPSSQFRLELGCDNILRLGSSRWTKIDLPGQESYESHYNPRSAYLRCTLLLGKQRQMKQLRSEMDSRFGR